MPEHAVYGGWPSSGEVDIMESRGNRNLFNPAGVNIGTEQVGSTLHFGVCRIIVYHESSIETILMHLSYFICSLSGPTTVTG